MAYQSPLHILSSLDIEPETLQAEDIKRLRKKLLAEFTLSQQTTIRIGNADYSKDEVIRMLDKLAEMRHLDVHVFIFRNKALLDFCEYPEQADPTDQLQVVTNFLETENKPELVEEIVGYALLEALAGSLKQKEYDHAMAWHGLAKNHFSSLQDTIDLTVVSHFADAGHTLEAINDENFRQRSVSRSVTYLTFPEWVSYLNAWMPDYQELFESFVSDVINLTVRLQRTDKGFCYNVSLMLCSLEVNPELKNLINENHEIYAAKYGKSTGSKEFSLPWGWLGFICFLLFRWFSDCGGGYKERTDYQNMLKTMEFNKPENYWTKDYYKKSDTVRYRDKNEVLITAERNPQKSTGSNKKDTVKPADTLQPVPALPKDTAQKVNIP